MIEDLLAATTVKDLRAQLADFDSVQVGYDLMANMLGSVVVTLSKTDPALFDDQAIYGMVRQALPSAAATEGGPEFVEAILAAALTRSIRQRVEASGG